MISTVAGEAANPSVAGVGISHPDRVLDSEGKVTKLDLALYYERIAPLLLPHLVDRPLSVVRCPRGFAGACFFQKHGNDAFSEAVKSIVVKDSSGEALYLAVDSVEGLVSLVQMNVVELHPWGSRGDLLERPDRLFFDLDPAPDVAWEDLIEGALRLRDVLGRMDVVSFVKTTGGKGLHVVVPLARKYTWDQVKAFSRAIAFEFAGVEPQRYVAVAAKAARKGRIFVDYLRNSRGATAVAPYSVRARAGAPISQPVSWKELESLEGPAAFRLEGGGAWKKPKGRDPWAAFLGSRQKLPPLSKRSAR